jgi:hypothetical protein
LSASYSYRRVTKKALVVVVVEEMEVVVTGYQSPERRRWREE